MAVQYIQGDTANITYYHIAVTDSSTQGSTDIAYAFDQDFASYSVLSVSVNDSGYFAGVTYAPAVPIEGTVTGVRLRILFGDASGTLLQRNCWIVYKGVTYNVIAGGAYASYYVNSSSSDSGLDEFVITLPANIGSLTGSLQMNFQQQDGIDQDGNHFNVDANALDIDLYDIVLEATFTPTTPTVTLSTQSLSFIALTSSATSADAVSHLQSLTATVGNVIANYNVQVSHISGPFGVTQYNASISGAVTTIGFIPRYGSYGGTIGTDVYRIISLSNQAYYKDLTIVTATSFTLPSSGTITMGMVKAVLGIADSTVLALTDSRVRTLFGKSSGVIKLTDGYGKTGAVICRPISISNSGNITPSNPSYAYDTPSNPNSVDTSTYESIYAVPTRVDAIKNCSQIFTFGTGVVSGILHVYVKNVETEEQSFADEFGDTTSISSTAVIEYSLNGGTDWYTFTDNGQTSEWIGVNLATNVDLTHVVSNVNLSNFKVRVTAGGSYNTYGNIGVGATLSISDIVILNS